VIFVEVHPKQLCDVALCALWAVPRDAHRDKHQLLLEDHQLGERRFLVCPQLVGLPGEGDVADTLLESGISKALDYVLRDALKLGATTAEVQLEKMALKDI